MANPKNRKRQVFLQKHSPTLEFCGFDYDADRADFSVDLGDLDLVSGMTKADVIKKLERLLRKLKAHDGDVFVVQ